LDRQQPLLTYGLVKNSPVIINLDAVFIPARYIFAVIGEAVAQVLERDA
jgi:hypothetical protein